MPYFLLPTYETSENKKLILYFRCQRPALTSAHVFARRVPLPGTRPGRECQSVCQF